MAGPGRPGRKPGGRPAGNPATRTVAALGRAGRVHGRLPAGIPLLPADVVDGRDELGRRVARLVPVAAAVLLGYLVTLGSKALAQPAPAVNPRLASFLAGHHLRYGLSGYWQADAMTLATGNQIQVPALQVNQASVSASHWESDASWYDPSLPAQTYDLGRYTVLVWHQNLLRRL